ncbi:MAG: hypothetical protein ABI910_11425 [Gemmatimonadota bacterium]
MRRFQSVILAATFSVLALVAAPSAGHAQRLTVKEEKPGLLAKAKVTPEKSLATGHAAVPKGTLKSAEIETEDGELVVVCNLTTTGVSGVDEVLIDATSGKLVSTDNESSEDEAKEKAKEAKTKKKPTSEADSPTMTSAASARSR